MRKFYRWEYARKFYRRWNRSFLLKRGSRIFGTHYY